jgi:hypothetical protein
LLAQPSPHNKHAVFSACPLAFGKTAPRRHKLHASNGRGDVLRARGPASVGGGGQLGLARAARVFPAGVGGGGLGRGDVLLQGLDLDVPRSRRTVATARDARARSTARRCRSSTWSVGVFAMGGVSSLTPREAGKTLGGP